MTGGRPSSQGPGDAGGDGVSPPMGSAWSGGAGHFWGRVRENLGH